MPQTDIYSLRDPTSNASSLFSIGTAFAIDGLEMFYRNPANKRPDTVVINVITLIRNRLGQKLNNDTTISNVQLLNYLKLEIAVLVADIGSIMQYMNVPRPAIMLYLIDSTHSILKTLQRPVEESIYRSQLNSAVRYIIVHYKELFSMISDIPGVDIRIDVYTRSDLPHKHLGIILRQMSHAHDVMMLSHMPIDYHIAAQLNRFLLLESHTGHIKQIAEIGPKVFKKNIPFNRYTHACLGDKECIKSPLSLKQRKAIYDMAEERHWNVRTLNEIKNDIATLGITIPIEFN